jgi:hypothetical protein
MNRQPTGTRRRARTARGVVAVAMVSAVASVGCVRRPPPPPPPPPPGQKVTTFEDEADRVQAATPDTRPWFCNSTGMGTPPSGHGNGSHMDPAYAGRTKGPLPWDTCRQLAAQLDQTLGAVQGLETRGQAEAAGYFAMGAYLPGLGTHHGTFQTLNYTTFDPAKPTFLIYGGNAKTSPLMGVAWRVPNNPAAPPEGYVGGNDWYHKHSRICTAPGLAGGEEVTDEDCKALGGTNVTIPGGGDYLLHVWLNQPYEYRPDIFVSGHPCLMADGVAPMTDPCWETAHKDPSLVTPPPPADDHGAHGH